MSPLKSYLGPNITGKEKVFLSLHFSESMLNFGGVYIIYIYIFFLFLHLLAKVMLLNHLLMMG